MMGEIATIHQWIGVYLLKIYFGDTVYFVLKRTNAFGLEIGWQDVGSWGSKVLSLPLVYP